MQLKSLETLKLKGYFLDLTYQIVNSDTLEYVQSNIKNVITKKQKSIFYQYIEINSNGRQLILKTQLIFRS